MKQIQINYKNQQQTLKLSILKAFPNDVFEVEFRLDSLLGKYLESPVYIELKGNILSFQEVKNDEQRDLLMQIGEEINKTLSKHFYGK